MMYCYTQRLRISASVILVGLVQTHIISTTMATRSFFAEAFTLPLRQGKQNNVPFKSFSLKNTRFTITSRDQSTSSDNFSFGGDSYWLKQMQKQGEEREELQWFRDQTSLPFSCTACGKCCKTKGKVYMTPEEHGRAATLLKISKEDFIQEYVSHIIPDGDNGDWVRLMEKPSNSDNDPNITEKSHGCIFLNDDNTCQIYEARPIQCSTYPFWPQILKSKEAWNHEVRRADNDNRPDLPPWSAEAGGCEGMKIIEESEDTIEEGVPLTKVYEQLHLYEFDERRHPRTLEEIPVERKEPVITH